MNPKRAFPSQEKLFLYLTNKAQLNNWKLNTAQANSHIGISERYWAIIAHAAWFCCKPFRVHLIFTFPIEPYLHWSLGLIKNSYFPMIKKPFSVRKRVSVYIKKRLCQFVYIDSQLRFQVASFVFMDNITFSQFVQHSADFW